jgi:sigma-B regulation protein RsbU (phosphoserine phosphatase)
MELALPNQESIQPRISNKDHQAPKSSAIILPYEPAVHPKSRLDENFDAAWARSLRRRVLWYCSLKIVFSALCLTWAVAAIIEFDDIDHVDTGSQAIKLLLFIAAWCYAWRQRRNRNAIFALAFWLYLIVGLMSLALSRYGPALEDLFGGDRDGQSSSAPKSGVKLCENALEFGSSVPWEIFFHHLIFCLFLPWNFRQSMRPALVLLAAVTVISLLDVAAGKIGWHGLLSPLKVMLALIPGSLWCWWRFRRSRNYFKLLYESSAYQELQSELDTARRIHEAQLPGMRTHGPVQLYYGYEPMQQVGGDLLFSHPPADIQADKITAVLFDVTGHGVTAALFVNRLVGELERCCGENPDVCPNELVTALNTHVYCTLARHGMYVTAVAVQIDLKKNLLTYANAGHPDALMIRTNAATERLASTTYMLGVMEPSVFTSDQVTTQFEKGDSIVLYTDGAFEARSAESGQQLGIHGLQSVLENASHSPCSEWPRSLLLAVTAHRQSPPEDDTLIAVIRREL